MTDNANFTDQFAAKLAIVEAEFAELSVPATVARKELKIAEDNAFTAQQRFGNFVAQLNRATKDGGTLSRAIEDILAAEMDRRDVANSAATVAKHKLANLEHQLDCLRIDIGQLRRAIDPPRVIQLEVAPRGRSEVYVDDDIIMPPSGGQAA